MRNDMRVVLRGMVRAPGTAIFAIIALCAGTAAITSIYTVARGVLLRGLPYPDSERLVLVWRGTARDPLDRGALSPADFVDVREQAGSFSDAAAVNSFSTTYLPEDGDPEQVQLGVVGGDFFGTIGARALLGRPLAPSDDRQLDTRDPATVSVVVLQHEFWTRAFGADPAVVGRTIDFGGSRMTVVGVMPEDFALHMPGGAGMSTDLVGWTPLGIDYTTSPRDGAYLKLIARLAPGATLAQAQAELDVISSRLRDRFREHEESGMLLRAASLEREVVAHIRPILLLLAASGVLLLIVACANAAALLLVRFMSRRHEVAVRRAIGAGDWNVLRPLLLESGVIAVGATVAGLLLASPAVKLLLQLEPGIVPRTGRIEIDAGVIAVALILALVITLICGIAPAVLVTRGELPAMLRAQRAGSTPGAQRLRRVFILLQATAAFALLYSSASLVSTLVRLNRMDVGFANANVLSARVTLPFTRYRGPDAWVEFHDELARRLRLAPGVEAAALTSDLPMEGEQTLEPYAPAELAATSEWGRFNSLYRIVTPDRLFPGIDPIGRRVAWTGDVLRFTPISGDWRTVVGVVANTQDGGLDAAPSHAMYMPFAQMLAIGGGLVIRADSNAAALVPAATDIIRGIAPTAPLDNVMTIEQIRDQSVAPRRLNAVLLSSFGILALIIAAVGIGGVLAFSVSARTNEIGIRMSLGADSGRVQRMILGEGGLLLAVGLVLGVTAAFFSARMIRGLLFGVAPYDPVTFGVVAVVMTAIGIGACWIPALRAARVDPARAMRS